MHDEVGDEIWYGGHGTASYLFTRAELDQATTLSFDVRPKLFGSGSSVTLTLLAFDRDDLSLRQPSRRHSRRRARRRRRARAAGRAG